jgi:BNR repeat-like domain/Glycosyl hydrolases family 32 N-terminal domain
MIRKTLVPWLLPALARERTVFEALPRTLLKGTLGTFCLRKKQLEQISVPISSQLMLTMPTLNLMKYISPIVFLGFVTILKLQSVYADPPKVVLQGEKPTELAPHQLGNVYAPEVHRHGEKLWMWYGGQGRDGHDRIHFAESTDGTTWSKRGVVIDNGRANHVNDPSVVRKDGQWWMFYTVAAKGEQDEIAAASSQDGTNWTLHGVVLATGTGSEWDSGKVGRPAVIMEDGKFCMWYDGQPSESAVQSGDELCLVIRAEGRAVGYAESTDGLNWQKRPAPVFRHGAGAVHVAKHQKRYILVYESGRGTLWASSDNKFDWQDHGMLLNLSGKSYDQFGQVTPFLLVEDQSTMLYFGAAARQTWDGNAIAVAKVTIP